MSEYGFYLERARKASAMLASMEIAASRRPGDLALRLNVMSAQRLLARTERELVTVALREQIDLCRYRLIATGNGKFSVRGVSRSLGAFQEVFSFVYDAIADSPKQIARLPRARHDETSLEFGYTFDGSLGVVMIATRSLSLFGSSEFGAALDEINGVFDTTIEEDLREKVKKLGRASIQKIYEWSNINFAERFGVDLRWLTPSTIHKGRYLEWKEFERITSLIGRTSDTETKTISAVGTLVGFSSAFGTFHFVEPEGESFRGQVVQTFPTTREWTVNRTYIAKIEIRKITRLATGEEVVRNYLRDLEEVQ
jgi:hypothetical protein